MRVAYLPHLSWGLSTCDVDARRDNTRNRALIDRFGILSFPVGKIFHRGRLVGDYVGGSLAHEIVAEMLTMRDNLRRAEEALETEAASIPTGASAGGGAPGTATPSKDEL